ncbi:ABC transporter ATP-binding protein [Paenibacillus solisilvae]|uniref:ABC transporter ATP-binding protein n=1 Tax=Paenibacillus solisilvae TaxID=2486751 RepID=A0ABW0W296_9BACL
MLEVKGLVAGYDKVMILRDVNINVQNGEVVSIIGRNGVGKSTFIKTIIGLLKAKSGNVVFKDQNMVGLKPYERAHLGIGYVPQGHGMFPRLTVEENIRMGEQINKQKTAKNYDLVYDFFPKLKTRHKQMAGTLSGGEQAMLAIGRALVGNPDLLLLDEPSEGIQPNLVEQISETIGRINGELGLTVLFVEQNIAMIQKMSHRCYAMDKGSIVGEIPREDLSDYRTIQRYLAV